jgi:acyl-CoA thioester hydrolase
MHSNADLHHNVAPFELIIRVRYAECDAQQVVFNARYGDYVDLAATEYFRYTLGDYRELLKSGIDNQVVRLATDWQSPARFDDVLSVCVKPDRIGTSSYSIGVEICEFFSRRPIARSEVVYVMVTADSFKKMPIPSEFRDKLAVGCPGKIINQSGLQL